MVTVRSLLLVLMTTALLTGCYWSSPPASPHGNRPVNLEEVPVLTVTAAPAQLESRRVLVLGRFDSLTTQPIGGLYDFDEYSASPLIRTYYFKFAHLELFEHACDALRASGLDVRKDYATTGEPTLIERPLRDKNPFVIRAVVQSFQHDQIRTDTDPPTDNEVVQLIVDVTVTDVQGNDRYRARHAIDGRVRYDESVDLLRMLGLKLGERLTHDAKFVQAIEARVRGGS